MSENSVYSSREINEIRQKLDTGYLIPLEVKGSKMKPFLKEGRDKVFILKRFSTPERGSIVLMRREDGNYQLTRVCKVCKDSCYVMFDRDIMSSGPVKLQDCIAEVRMIERNGKTAKDGLLNWYFGGVRIMAKDFISDGLKMVMKYRAKK